MGLVSVGDLKIERNVLRPTVIFPFTFSIKDENPTLIAVLITMYTWGDFFDTVTIVSKSLKLGALSIQNPLDFDFEIPFETIRKLENRKKNDLGFEFRIGVIYDCVERVVIGQGLSPTLRTTKASTDSITKRIPLSDWKNFLTECGYSERTFFALRQDVVEELDKFRDKLGSKISYDDAILELLRRAEK